MNLQELLGPNGLQQDEWSLTAPKFGKEGQLEVVGWSGRQGSAKLYILKCSTCAKDVELFGQGYFSSKKGNLVNLGSMPCGCAFNPKWSKDQYITRCKRRATELGYTFLGFVGEWKGQTTKIRMLCEKHGQWGSGVITHLINKGYGCPECGTEAVAETKTKSDDVMIDSFMSSGGFAEGTKFWRSDRKNKQGWPTYWHILCPACGETGESYSGNLQRGQRPCACSSQRQTECYINWLIDDNDMAVAIKFGIARDSGFRLKQQDSKSVYMVKQYCVYQFPDVTSCKKAERECSELLECGVVLRRDMLDGYTETTYVCNLDKIIEIYERNGGTKNE